MEPEMLEQNLRKYFSKQKNIDYIMKKTNGPNQVLKIYEILCMINDPKNEREDKLSKAIEYLKNDQLLWSNPTFDVEKKKIEEENDFMVCPYEISEGVLTCGKCGCKKIFSFSKQTRSMDEPTTVFALCSECGNKWCEGS
jgi:DNA-directed RNA polymerase subunit M/transcription elongation factor TFIIS